MRRVVFSVVVALSMALVLWLNLQIASPAPLKQPKAQEPTENPRPSFIPERINRKPSRKITAPYSGQPTSNEENPIEKEEGPGFQWTLGEDFTTADLLEVLGYIEDLENTSFEDEKKEIDNLLDLRGNLMDFWDANIREGREHSRELLLEIDRLHEREQNLFEDIMSHPILKKYFNY